MIAGKKPMTRKSIFNALRWAKRFTHPVGGVNFGHLRRIDPISDNWGFDRGLPIDRYYIESFLEKHANDIHGRTLEVANNAYTTRFGGDRVTRSDILHHQPGNPAATLVADLTKDNNLPDNAFDCVICTQTLPFIYDLSPAIGTLYRILKPGGVLLVTLPGISRISPQDMDRTGDYWRFTDAAARKLFTESFNEKQLNISVYGNVLAAVSFLHGLACQELTPAELDHTDDNFQLLITVRAVK
jgi:SAM-dependent methyltransferase